MVAPHLCSRLLRRLISECSSEWARDYNLFSILPIESKLTVNILQINLQLYVAVLLLTILRRVLTSHI